MIHRVLLLAALSSCLFPVDYEIVTESSNPEVCSMIRDGLEDFNMKFFRQVHHSLEIESFVVYAKDGLSQILGGLHGYIVENDKGSWAGIEYAWVDEGRRHEGIGTQLFAEAEKVAKRKNCSYVQLYTWAYQAVGFYEKLGFECVGTIPFWIEDYDAVFFRKRLN
jgi:GNAT superfamily N-acetyltransferase